MSRPARPSIGDGQSIFFAEPEAGIAAGLVFGVYAGVYLILLARDAWHPLPDLVSFALYAAICLTGTANVLRWATAVPAGSVLAGVGFGGIMCGWAIVTLRHDSPLSDGEGLAYGIIAALVLAAVIGDVREKVTQQPRVAYPWQAYVIPALAFSLWGVVTVGGVPSGLDWIALILEAAGCALVAARLFRAWRR